MLKAQVGITRAAVCRRWRFVYWPDVPAVRWELCAGDAEAAYPIPGGRPVFKIFTPPSSPSTPAAFV
jgi:hypothetical protein